MDRTQDSGSCNLGSTPSWRIHQEVQILNLFFVPIKIKNYWAPNLFEFFICISIVHALLRE